MLTETGSNKRLKKTNALIKSKGWQYESWNHGTGFCFASIEKQPYERGPHLSRSDIRPKFRYYLHAESLHEAVKRLVNFS